MPLYVPDEINEELAAWCAEVNDSSPGRQINVGSVVLAQHPGIWFDKQQENTRQRPHRVGDHHSGSAYSMSSARTIEFDANELWRAGGHGVHGSQKASGDPTAKTAFEDFFSGHLPAKEKRTRAPARMDHRSDRTIDFEINELGRGRFDGSQKARGETPKATRDNVVSAHRNGVTAEDKALARAILEQRYLEKTLNAPPARSMGTLEDCEPWESRSKKSKSKVAESVRTADRLDPWFVPRSMDDVLGAYDAPLRAIPHRLDQWHPEAYQSQQQYTPLDASRWAEPRGSDASDGQSDLYDVSGQKVTTVMLRNLPNRLKVNHVTEKLEELGFANEYDYLYMPRDLQSRANKGYTFVNFTTSSAARAFVEQVDGKQLADRASSKLVAVSAATAQGVMANLKTISHMCWKDEAHMPRVRINGEFLHLEPTVAIRMLKATSYR
jgi:hypothetical protein